MATPTINWATKVITIPQSFLTYISGSLYELDVDELRLVLKDIEDSEEGMSFLDTHRHNTQVTLSGVTYARTLEIINGYTVTFENGNYTVRCVGANHNLADVKNVNYVSLIIGNSAGLIVSETGVSGLSTEEHDTLMKVDSIKPETDKIGGVKAQTDQFEFHAGVLATVDEFIGTAITQLDSKVSDIKGVDGDTLKSLSDQLDTAQADLDDPNQYKADVSGLASQASVDALGVDIGALTQDVADLADIVILLKAFATNKKYLQKVGSTWYLIIKNSLETADILNKALKDKAGNDITDIAAGILAMEMGSSV